MLTTQQPKSRRQMTFFSKLTEVVPHIRFDCIVNGKKLTASLTHLEDTEVLTLYHVSFSDGHQDAYLPADADVRQRTGRPRAREAYEASIYSDLSILQTFIKTNKKGVTNFRVYELRGESFNVWLYEQRGFYSVYYKGEYRFTLRKRLGWEVGTNGEKGVVINQQLASLISKQLDLHLQ